MWLHNSKRIKWVARGMRRAYEGWRRIVYHHDKLVGGIHEDEETRLFRTALSQTFLTNADVCSRLAAVGVMENI